jgi:RNA polymerase sigma factor (sigma-70 family)
MAAETRNVVLLKDVRTLFDFGVSANSSDRQLLDRFLTAGQPDAEKAFTLLVERHGPMVLHVCRQILGDSHDSQDAFQATFLVFLRQARSIRKRDSLASWLFGVAMRVARRARYAGITRRFHERKASERAEVRALDLDAHSERRAGLHEEIARLPDRFREPIVLCHLEGLSTATAAQRLGCAPGTILSRLARGRERLRRRLTQRGLTVQTSLFTPPYAPPEVGLTLPAALVNSAVRYAAGGGAGGIAPAVAMTRSVATLTEATLRHLYFTRITLAAALLATATAATLCGFPAMRWIYSGRAQAASAAKEALGKHEKPRPTREIQARADEAQFSEIVSKQLAEDFEAVLYRVLKQNRGFDDPDWAFKIKFGDVREKTLIDATFLHRSKGRVNEYDTIIQARRAVLHVDLIAKIIYVDLEEAEIQRAVASADVFFKNNVLEIPIPVDSRFVVNHHLLPRLEAPRDTGSARINNQALSLAYAPNSKTLVTSGFDGLISLWNPVQNKKVGELKAGALAVRFVKFAPNGNTLVSLTDAGEACLWDLSTGSLKKRFPLLSGSARLVVGNVAVGSATFSADGSRLAISAWGNGIDRERSEYIFELRVLDAQAGLKWSHVGRGEKASSLAFSPDDKILASAGWKDVRLWNSWSGEPLRTLRPTRGGINAVAFTPDGRTLIGGGIDRLNSEDRPPAAGLLTIWNVATGDVLHALEGHGDVVRTIAVAPNGKTFASGNSGPAEVKLWDISTGKLKWAIKAAKYEILSLAFAPDGRTLIYSDKDGVFEIDAETGKLARTISLTTPVPVQKARE